VRPETGASENPLFPEKIAKDKGEKIGNVIWVSAVRFGLSRKNLFSGSEDGDFPGERSGIYWSREQDAGGVRS
jgi:hypothetical protein